MGNPTDSSPADSSLEQKTIDMVPRITALMAREILDSRGNPTVECELTVSAGLTYRAACPSGASTGENEACELRDADPSRYRGKGVLKAVASVTDVIAPAVIGLDVRDATKVDKVMIDLDGTGNKSRLGANAILSVSMAVHRAAAAALGMPLHTFINSIAGTPKMVMPVPCFNVINGGVHAGNQLAPQEFFLIPVEASDFHEALRMGSETYHVLKDIIKARYGIDSTAVGDEGGFAPNVNDPEEALKLLVDAIESAGYTGKIVIGSDPAASEWYIKGSDKYDLDFKMNPDDRDPAHLLTRQQLVDFWSEMAEKYPIMLLEDPFDENDFEGHAMITARIGDTVEIVGDDLYCTNVELVRKGLEMKSTNAMLLKVNQIGSVSESIDAFKLCKENQWGVFVSHRSGETEDTFIADLTVGLGAGHLKTGAPCRGERTAKYNQLLRIEESHQREGAALPYAGQDFRKSGLF